MVHLQLGCSNEHILLIADELARRFESRIIGIAAAQPLQLSIGDDYVSGDMIDQELDEIAGECQKAESEFRTVVASGKLVSEWRSITLTPNIAAYIAHQSRSADIILTTMQAHSSRDTQRQAKLPELLMRSGRPLIVVSALVKSHAFNTILIGWKDTRETRRAIQDALPLLRRASHICIVEMIDVDDDSRAYANLSDVCAWLHLHHVDAVPIVCRSRAEDASALLQIAQEQAADVIVAGAYGHSRLQEWVLGGITRDLLGADQYLSFLSH